MLDLGCGVGDLAAELVARGARVIGFDTNEQLIRTATSPPRVRVEGDIAVRDYGSMGSFIFRWGTEAGAEPPRRGVAT